jgi:hypothetical protein
LYSKKVRVSNPEPDPQKIETPPREKRAILCLSLASARLGVAPAI